MPKRPTLFVPHGAPTFALRPGAAGAAMAAFAQNLPRPRAIVMVSAHWDTEIPTVGFAAQPETLYDFWGFPRELYALRYPAPGCPTAAAAVASALQAAGLPVRRDDGRGLDHGAWIPLRLMFPAAEVPVIPLSIQSRGGPESAYRLGQALAALVEQDFLLIASGNVTHNLHDFQLAARNDGQAPAYVGEFTAWLAARLAAHDIPALLDYRRQAPGGARAHPSEEHLLPLFVALGAGGDRATVERIYAGDEGDAIAMDAYSFSPP